MIGQSDIKEIARDVATANLTSSAVRDILVEPTINSRGDEALRITIVLESSAVDGISGDDTLNTLVQMQKRLDEAGEDRFPIVGYATEEELQEIGDS